MYIMGKEKYSIMKKRHLVFCVLLITLAVGCNKEKKGEMVFTSNQPETTQTVIDSGEEEIQVYTIDMNSMQSVSETVYLMDGEEVTAENILREVVELFKVNAIEIEINGFKQKKDIMYISFAKESAPVTGVSKKVEEVILESIAKSILDNIEDVEKIVFQVDSGAYKSENLDLEENEAYWWK